VQSTHARSGTVFPATLHIVSRLLRSANNIGQLKHEVAKRYSVPEASVRLLALDGT
jgi:hypothetical protein